MTVVDLERVIDRVQELTNELRQASEVLESVPGAEFLGACPTAGDRLVRRIAAAMDYKIKAHDRDQQGKFISCRETAWWAEVIEPSKSATFTVILRGLSELIKYGDPDE